MYVYSFLGHFVSQPKIRVFLWSTNERVHKVCDHEKVTSTQRRAMSLRESSNVVMPRQLRVSFWTIWSEVRFGYMIYSWKNLEAFKARKCRAFSAVTLPAHWHATHSRSFAITLVFCSLAKWRHRWTSWQYECYCLGKWRDLSKSIPHPKKNKRFATTV